MIIKLLSVIRGPGLLVTTLLMTSGILSAIDRYSDPAGVNNRIGQLQKSAPALVKVHKLALTPGGREMLMMEISNSGAAAPAVFVAANMSGTTPLATEAALSLAQRLIKNGSLHKGHTWYILPVGNPDAYARYFAQPLYSDTGNATPFNDDTDELTDEDGFNDLDGNGIITQMRVRTNDGTWIPVEGEPRLMRRADEKKGERGIYKLYTEGIDDDGDGKYNEDPPGGTNIDANFPHLFKNFGRRSGLFAGSEPESEAIMKFAFSHPEIAMVLSFGQTNFLLAPPQGGRKGSYDADNIRVPAEIGNQFGIDVSRRYNMQEIMELVQPVMPPGMNVDESMIASFLGLGAVVNPMKEDLDFYNEISSEYKDYLKKKGVTTERFDPEQPDDGSFELWAYYHLGVPVFSMDFWGVPKPKEEKKEGGLTADALEKMSDSDFMALGEEKIGAFLRESGAPAQYNAKMVMGMVSNGQVKPAQLAAMMRQMPKQTGSAKEDAKKGDAKETALLAYIDEYNNGRGFVPWKPYNHPTLGEVEIGGFVPFSVNTPPAEMVDSLLDLHLPYLYDLVAKLPELKLADVKVTEKGGGVYQIDLWVSNQGYLPFPTAMGKRNTIPAPSVIVLEGDRYDLLSGKKRTIINSIGGLKSEKYTWLVATAKKSSLTFTLESKQAGKDSKQIIIGG
jgi:hypothetical protein